jgi:hypothetical protein
MDSLVKYFSFNKYSYLKKLELSTINSLLYIDDKNIFFNIDLFNLL